MEQKVPVVISGAAGEFPECRDIPELEENLFRKAHLVTNDDRKFKRNYSFSCHCGKAFFHEKFDAIFFNVPFSLPSTMDAISKKSLEASVEAIIDAGVNPKSLSGSRTAVYAVYDFSELEMSVSYTQSLKVLLGSARTFTSNRLSFALNLHGPSYTSQGGHGAAFHFIDLAKSQLEEGHIDAAIVVTANFMQTARTLAILDGMGLAAKDGKCCSFDREAHGYALSDGCVAFFLQRESDARRNWATVIGADHRFFGAKRGNVLTFDKRAAREMLHQLYSKWNVDPAQVGYIEADGSGIKDRDIAEADIISSIFCRNRKNSLLIGSIKSNMGHAQSAACAAGAVKALIALSSSKIPPNIHIDSPIPELTSKGIKVVTETTPLRGEYIGVNSIGLLGHFGHILLRANPRKSVSSVPSLAEKSLPQILLLSSRTEKGMEQAINYVKKVKVTPEFAGLVNGVFRHELRAHMYRGYGIIHQTNPEVKFKSQRADGGQRPIWWVFSGMGSQWNGMGSHLMCIPIFRDVINRCDKVLSPRGVDIKHILTTDDEKIFDNILHAFVGITAVQIGLVEVLRALELEPEGIVGHSVGELGCAYADNCLTLEQTILAAYARGRASLESTLIRGMMAAIGMSNSEIVGLLPDTIDVACRNSDTSCTISGPAADVDKFVVELKSKGVFAKAVNVSNIAYHSRYIQPAAPILLKYLKEVIPKNTKRSSKWISSSVPKLDWKTNLATYSSPEYHTNNLLSPVLFEEAIQSIPRNAVLVEIAPHGLLQAILKRAVSSKVSNVPLTLRSTPDGVKFLLDAIGDLYLLGFKPNVSALYPAIQFPVPRDTPSLQPLVTWDHSETYGTPAHLAHADENALAISETSFTLKEIRAILRTYQERSFPISTLSFYLIEVWKILGALQNAKFERLAVVFENIQIYSEVNLATEGTYKVWIQVMRGTGDFCVFQETLQEGSDYLGRETSNISEEHKRSVLLTGRISVWEKPNRKFLMEDFMENNTITQFLTGTDLDGFFLEFSETVPGLRAKTVTNWNISDKGVVGKISWNSDWTVSLDTTLKLNILEAAQSAGQALEPVSIQFIRVDPTLFEKQEKGSKIDFIIDSVAHHFECNGLMIDGLKTQPISKDAKGFSDEDTERLYFVPYEDTAFKNLNEFMRASLQIIRENSGNNANDITSLPLKLCIYKANGEQSDIMDLFQNSLQSSGFNIKVELTHTNHVQTNGSKFWARLAIVTNLKSLSHLTSMSNGENAYLFAGVSSETTMKDVKYSAASLGQDYTVIYEQVFGSLRYGLMKRRNPKEKIKVHHVLENLSLALDTLKSMTMAQNTAVIIPVPPTVNPALAIRRIMRTTKMENLRIFVLLADSAPPFSLSNNLYRKQMERGLVVNVLQNGKWGSFRGELIPKTRGGEVDQIFAVGNNALKEIDMKYIGLNPAGSKNRDKETPTALDYSGVTSSGSHVIGIAYKHKGPEKRICLDPIFQWTVPSSLPFYEAVTLPSAYLTAHWIMDRKIETTPTKQTALILNGQTPTGMACISLFLSCGYSIFSTVPDEAAYQHMTLVFPQIPKSHITNHNSEDFYVPLMFATKGTGADVIVSDLPSRQMLSAWKCTGQYGSFINLNEDTMEHNAPLPMGQFRESTGYHGFNQSCLELMPEEEKIRLRTLVNESLKSGRIASLPHEILDPDNLSQLPRSNEQIANLNRKLVLEVRKDLSDCKTKSGTKHYSKRMNGPKDGTLGDTSQRTSVIITSAVKKAVNIVKWSLRNGVKRIVLATLGNTSSHCVGSVRQINSLTSKHEATLLMTTLNKAQAETGVEKLLTQAKRLGDISTITTVSLDENTGILACIDNHMSKFNRKCSWINLQRENSDFYCTNMIPIVWYGDADCTHVLDHALFHTGPSSTYIISNRTKTSKYKTDLTIEEPITDYLPSSLEELEEIGDSLCRDDTVCGTPTIARFLRTASLAPDTTARNKDVFPIFVIPAFCKTQLKPLISRLMYPCYVAHMHPDAKSIKDIVASLHESMLKVQSGGSYTIVGETWSGGIAMLLSKLLSDSKHEVSLFLLQGVPKKMIAMIPPALNLNEHLIKVLLGLKEKDNQGLFKEQDEEQRLKKALELLPTEFNKTNLMRSFKTIQKNVELQKELLDHRILLDCTLFLMEVGRYCKLSTESVDELSKKPVHLVKTDCENYKTMLSDPRLVSKIAEEAAFSW